MLKLGAKGGRVGRWAQSSSCSASQLHLQHFNSSKVRGAAAKSSPPLPIHVPLTSAHTTMSTRLCSLHTLVPTCFIKSSTTQRIYWACCVFSPTTAYCRKIVSLTPQIPHTSFSLGKVSHSHKCCQPPRLYSEKGGELLQWTRASALPTSLSSSFQKLWCQHTTKK